MPVLHGCSSFNTHPGFENTLLGLLVVLGVVQEPSGFRGLVEFFHQSSNSEAASLQLQHLQAESGLLFAGALRSLCWQPVSSKQPPSPLPFLACG